jgi:hypothetical protein
LGPYVVLDLSKGGMEMRKIETVFIFGVVILMLVLGGTSQIALAKSKPPPPPPPPPQSSETFTMWINHLDFIPGDPTVSTSFALNPNVGTGLLIGSTATGIDQSVEKSLQVSPGFLISGVRVCYELSSSSSFISNISLARLQNPPTGLSLLLNDTTDLTNKGPICVDSAAPSNAIDPSLGAVRLRLGVNFASDKDSIVVRAVGLHLVLDPDGPIEHTHIYLTGKGVGHNNTEAITSEPIFP